MKQLQQNMKTKYALVFNRKGTLLETSEEALIQIEAYLNGKRRYFSTGVYVSKAHWDSKRLEVRDDHPDEALLNKTIKKKLTELKDLEMSYASKSEPFSLDCFDQLWVSPKIVEG
jgi:hypothetical protein